MVRADRKVPAVSRSALARAVLALAVLAASTYVVLTRPARLGLDLRGGTQIVLQARDTGTARADAEATDRALEVLRRRVDALGVTEPVLARSGDNRIIVELPGVQDPARAREVIGRSAQLTIHPVVSAGQTTPPADPTTPPPTRLPDLARGGSLPDESGQSIQVGPVALSGAAIGGASAVVDSQGLGGWQVTIEFRGPGSRRWQQLTAEAACAPDGDPRRRIAIVLDGEVISSPQVASDVRCDVGIGGGSTVITGRFTEAEANDLAVLVRAGALPVPVDVIEQRTVGATLGADAIRDSTRGAVIGVALTVLFVVAVYRLAGLVAAVALVGYGLISYAVLLGLGATLTLPGIAGFVLAIGMAIDANVLVFERAREEYEARGRLRRAVRDGFRGAMSAIVDSNITTLLAAALLFFLATGPVRGFGVTLSVGVLTSMFAALVVTRALLELTAGSRFAGRRPGWTGLADIGAVRRGLLRRRPDLMRYRRRWLLLSAVLVTVAAAGLVVRGPNLGVEFTGGRLVEFSTAAPVDPQAARRVVTEAGIDDAVVQSSGDRQVTLRAGDLDDAERDRVRAGLDRLGGDAEQVRDEFVGPSLGDELRTKALVALGLALAVQLAYLAVRFRPAFGAAAVLAMLQDVLILLGVFAWLGKTMDAVFLAALLTVVGYSVNDSVVVFDRVRELLRGRRGGATVADLATTACLQTVPRTVNTGLGAIFILAALALLGGSSLTDFAIALLVGILVGTWSSVFTATPLAIEFLDRRPGRGDRLRKPSAPTAPRTPAGRPRPAGADRRPVPRGVGRRDPTDSGARL
jgi:SecD/SecF fusion protein